MSNWYYYDNCGQKQGPINVAQLKVLASRGIITPDTFIENVSGHSRKAGDVNGLEFSSRSSAIPATPSVPPTPPNYSPIGATLQHKESSPIGNIPFIDFKAKPSLKWFFDLQFNLCYVFTFVKGIIQIIYTLFLAVCILYLFVGPIVQSAPGWYNYRSDWFEMADYKSSESSQKSRLKTYEKQQEDIENKLKQVQGRDKLKLEDELETTKDEILEIQSKLTKIRNDMNQLRMHKISFLWLLFMTLLITIGTWIMTLLSLFIVRLSCEFAIFTLGWWVDTRQAAQYIITNNQHTTK
jgi:hypothetical protein